MLPNIQFNAHPSLHSSQQLDAVLLLWPSLWQEVFLGRLCICDLVNDQTNTALRDDVRDTISNLNGNHGRGCIDAKHGEQVHNRVSAPTNHCHDLGRPDLARDDWVRLTVCGRGEAKQQLVDNIQKENHGNEPAQPPRSEVTSNYKFAIVSGDDHESRAQPKGPSLLAVFLFRELHDQEDLNQQQRYCEEPIHISIGIVEWHASQEWAPLRRVRVRIHPGVEDANVVVGSNEGDQT